MSEMLKKYGGLILFYLVLVLGVVLLNERCRYLNEQNKEEQNVISEIVLQIEGEKEHV